MGQKTLEIPYLSNLNGFSDVKRYSYYLLIVTSQVDSYGTVFLLKS